MSSCDYSIKPLNVGSIWLGKDHVLGDEYPQDERIEFALISFLVQGCGRNVLVDLGPKTLDYCNAMFHRFGFLRTLPDGSRPDDLVQPEGNVFDGLKRHGLSADDITDIIFTHLHADHHGMDDATNGGACEDFRNAVFHISRAGWYFNVARRRDGHWNSYIDWGFADCMMCKLEHGKMVAEDNAEIAPGLNTIYLGGHEICSQAVRIETAHGPVVIGSDEVYSYDLLEKAVLARISTSPHYLRDADLLLAEMAASEATLLPVHDPVVLRLYQEYGESWLSEARDLSARAAKSFLAHTGH